MNNKKKKIFVLLDNMPSKENPHCWKHAIDQVLKLSKECDITIVSPVCLTLSLRRFKKNRDLIKKLPQYRYEIESVICWRPRYIDFSFIPWKYRKHYFQILTMIVSLLFLLLFKRIKFDIIHAHFVYRPGYVAAILGKVFGKPVIITAHGSDIHQNLYKEGPLYRKRTIDALRWCSRIIAVSESLKKMIDEVGFKKKTCVIPCSFSEKDFYPRDKTECRFKLLLDPNKRIILFIGNLIRIKGVDILIEAFRIVRNKDDNVRLIIIGEGLEKAVLERQVRDCSLDKVVNFLGRKDHNEIPLYINSADIIVLPSRYEGRPVLILEALACGRPVVASRIGGIPETIVNDKLGILFEKENPIALADAIIKALEYSWDSSYQSNYVNKYNNTRLAQEILNVYGEVINKA